jgi:hypothetical protein
MIFTSIGIEHSNPNTTGLASNSTRKLLNKIPLVVREKTAANTASRVEAFKLVRIAFLLGRGVGASTLGNAVIWVISRFTTVVLKLTEVITYV